jgi:hypothetical protein
MFLLFLLAVWLSPSFIVVAVFPSPQIFAVFNLAVTVVFLHRISPTPSFSSHLAIGHLAIAIFIIASRHHRLYHHRL